MPRRNRHRSVGRLDRTGPRATRPGGPGPARPGREPAGPADYQLAGHDCLVIAVPGQLDPTIADRLPLAIIAVGDGYATPDPGDSGAGPPRDATGIGALVFGCLMCTDIDDWVAVDDPPPFVAQLLCLATVPAPD